MPESSLSLSYADLQEGVAHFLGYGRLASRWNDEQSADIESCIRSGLRQFYIPPVLPNESTSYEWSFLRPTTTIALADGEAETSLPDDFGSIDGQLTFAGTTSTLGGPLSIVSEGLVYQKQAELPDATGQPLVACVRPRKDLAPGRGQRFELVVWPTPDTDYTLRIKYNILPEALALSKPYPYGGMQHAETILESCLSIAEQRLDDMGGLHTGKFFERLAASINADRRLKPQLLGYNGDRSDRSSMNRREWHGLNPVTVNGVEY